ncbi:MAG: NYN domain-containing protein [Hyphomicrobium sp.]|nr:NYN domain-containing protein [Hyphomicrobium sp.]PPC82088.1 MAG: NYN domain-containing protein [Hyphomicrobium sp.]
MRIIAYIDGFNLYHAIDDIGKPDPRRPASATARRPHLKWLNLWTLCESFARQGEVLEGVNYFSAFATWREAHKRHIEYVKALEHAGVNCIMGHFKSKAQKCRNCGATWTQHEEKETDVHIASRIVFDAFEERYDRMILITADSDLAPALNLVKYKFPMKQIFVVAPPGRHGHARSLNPSYTLTPGRLERHLLPPELYDAHGRLVASRPASYAPPIV